jgi:hypothetical protein
MRRGAVANASVLRVRVASDFATVRRKAARCGSVRWSRPNPGARCNAVATGCRCPRSPVQVPTNRCYLIVAEVRSSRASCRLIASRCTMRSTRCTTACNRATDQLIVATPGLLQRARCVIRRERSSPHADRSPHRVSARHDRSVRSSIHAAHSSRRAVAFASRGDACVAHTDASPNVEITSAPHAVRFGATPCRIGSSTRAMRAGCVSGHLYTRWLRLIVSPLRLGAQSLRGHECDGCVVRVDASSALAIAYPERFLASLGLLVASCECRGCVATASMPAGTKYPLSLCHMK